MQILDTETEVPFHTLEPAPFNPKRPIHGIYKRGLKHSLAYFSLCDRLKVWPVPGKKARYIVLNGNQRLDIIKDLNTEHLIAEHFGLERDDAGQLDQKTLKSIQSDPENAAVLKRIADQVMRMPVPVMVMGRLDEEDAILFNAVYDRNHSVPDEAKIVSSVERIASKRRELVDRMARPDRALVNPLPPAADSQPRTVPGLAETPYISPKLDASNAGRLTDRKPADEYEAKYGPVPASHQRQPSPAPSPLGHSSTDAPQGRREFVPVVFSIPAESYDEINSSLYRCARKLRHQRLTDSLTNLENLLSEPGDSLDMDSLVFEVASLVILRRTESVSKK